MIFHHLAIEQIRAGVALLDISVEAFSARNDDLDIFASHQRDFSVEVDRYGR